MNRLLSASFLGGAALAALLSLGLSNQQQTRQLAAAASPAAPQVVNQAKTIAPYVSWYGPDSAIHDRSFAKVTSDEQWLKLWERHAGAEFKRDNIQRPVGLPSIDFNQCMVIAIFNGKKHNTNGVMVESIDESADRILFRYDESTYQVLFRSGEKAEMPDRHPFGIFVLPRSDKPVEVEENVQGLKNQPPDWKPRAKL